MVTLQHLVDVEVAILAVAAEAVDAGEGGAVRLRAVLLAVVQAIDGEDVVEEGVLAVALLDDIHPVAAAYQTEVGRGVGKSERGKGLLDEGGVLGPPAERDTGNVKAREKDPLFEKNRS